jgi:P27 family predicted phage terminase small subunit
MGRPNTPNAILKRRGSKHVREDEPEFSSAIGDPPAILSGRALEVWDELTQELKEVEVGNRVDAYALSELCQAVAQSEECARIISEEGLSHMTERGIIKHPLTSVQSSASMRVLRYSSAFGLTPTARGKISAPKKETKNPFADL